MTAKLGTEEEMNKQQQVEEVQGRKRKGKMASIPQTDAGQNGPSDAMGSKMSDPSEPWTEQGYDAVMIQVPRERTMIMDRP